MRGVELLFRVCTTDGLTNGFGATPIANAPGCPQGEYLLTTSNIRQKSQRIATLHLRNRSHYHRLLLDSASFEPLFAAPCTVVGSELPCGGKAGC